MSRRGDVVSVMRDRKTQRWVVLNSKVIQLSSSDGMRSSLIDRRNEEKKYYVYVVVVLNVPLSKPKWQLLNSD